MNPDGTPFEITINSPSNFEVESGRLAFAVANSWRKFGLTVNVQQLESGPFWTAESTGNFNAGSYWPGCGVAPDVYQNMDSAWNRKYIVPEGTAAPGNSSRFDNQAISDQLDALANMTSDDPNLDADDDRVHEVVDRRDALAADVRHVQVRPGRYDLLDGLPHP